MAGRPGNARAIRTFAFEIGLFGKAEALERVLRALEGRKYQTNRDLIPVEIWERVRAAKSGLSWRRLAVRIGLPSEGSNLHVGQRAPTRARLRQFAEALSDEELMSLASSAVMPAVRK